MVTAVTQPQTSFLDPTVLARIGNLELIARTVVDGFINGLHRSPYFGLSVDFAEHRPYNPGDDIRRVDWRLYARTDRYHVKEFEADTNANFFLLLDVSPSMDYASKKLTKLDYSRYLGACLTYFSHLQRDRVGMATFDRDMREYVPASAKHLEVILHTIDRLKPGQEGALERPMMRFAELLRRRGIVVLVSDFYEEPDAVMEALKPLRARGHDLVVFHVLDPAEVEFPFQDTSNFVDLESGAKLEVTPTVLREKYRAMVQEHIATLSRSMTEGRIDYTLLTTDTPLDHALFHYLSSRERLSRVR